MYLHSPCEYLTHRQTEEMLSALISFFFFFFHLFSFFELARVKNVTCKKRACYAMVYYASLCLWLYFILKCFFVQKSRQRRSETTGVKHVLVSYTYIKVTMSSKKGQLTFLRDFFHLKMQKEELKCPKV